MAKIKLTKGELKRQRDALKQYLRYLPTLQLKKQQLQMEILHQSMILESREHVEAVKRNAIEAWAGLLATDAGLNLSDFLKPKAVILGTSNIAGVDLAIFQRAAQRGFVRGGGGAHLGVRAREDDDHFIASAEAVHPLERFRAGFLEARRRFIRGLHGRRAVEDHDAFLRRRGCGFYKRSRQREHCQREQEDLQIEQPVLPQLLKRRAGLRVGEEFLPEQGAGYELHHTLALQKIENSDDGDGGGESN